jgi:hypothetical protein
VSRPALGLTQPPVKWVPGVLSPGLKRGRGMTLTTHSYLVPRSRMSRSYNPSPPSAFMACSGTALVLYTFYMKPYNTVTSHVQFMLQGLSSCSVAVQSSKGHWSPHTQDSFGRVVSPPQMPVPTQDKKNTENKGQISMSQVGFEPTFTASKRSNRACLTIAKRQ